MGNLVAVYTYFPVGPQKKITKKRKKRVTAPILKMTDDQKPVSSIQIILRSKVLHRQIMHVLMSTIALVLLNCPNPLHYMSSMLHL